MNTGKSGQLGKHGFGSLHKLNYRPQRNCGKIMFLHLSVILFTGGGGVWQTPPQADTPRQTPPGQTPPPPGDGHCSGRYASYWNACYQNESILLRHCLRFTNAVDYTSLNSLPRLRIGMLHGL